MLRKFLSYVSRFELLTTFVLFILALLILAINITLRYFLRSSLPWAEELMKYCMVWITFLGVSLCVEEDLHVGIDVFVDATPAATQNIFKLLAHGVGIIFSSLMTFHGTRMIIFLFNTGQKSSVLLILMWIVYLCMPLGAFFSTIRYIDKFIFYIKKIKKIEDSLVIDK